MKYYKDECLNTLTAKFKNPKMESNFHLELYGKRFNVVYLCTFFQVFWNIYMILMTGFDLSRLEVAIISFIFAILFKFSPKRFSQYFLMMLQIISTLLISKLNKERKNKNMEDTYFIVGQLQVIYWMIASQSFLVESLTMAFNFLYSIIQYEDFLYMGINMAFVCGFLTTYKYLHNISDRRLYLALKNFEQWESMNERIIPNLFIIQKFDFRTHRMLIHDCNKKAKEFNIEKSPEAYTKFLSSLRLQSIESGFSQRKISQFNNKAHPQYESLKDILLEKHASIYEKFLSKQQAGDMNTSKNDNTNSKSETHNKSQSYEEPVSEDVEQVNVEMVHPHSKKVMHFRVKVITLHMNEPFLIICLEDTSKLEKIKQLKKQRNIQNDMIAEFIFCLKQKIQLIQQQSQTSAQFIQQQLFYMRFMIDSFTQYLRPVKTEEFFLSEVVKKVQNLFSTHEEEKLEFKFDDNGSMNASDIILKQDKLYMFQILLTIISAIQVKYINNITWKVVKDAYCERLSMVINASNESPGISKDTNELQGLLETPRGNQINEICFAHLKRLMSQVCMTNEVKVESEIGGNNNVTIEIEFLANLNDLRRDSVLCQSKRTQVSSINPNSQLIIPMRKSAIHTASKRSHEISPVNHIRSEFNEKFGLDSQLNAIDIHASTYYPNRDRFMSTQILLQTGNVLSQNDQL